MEKNKIIVGILMGSDSDWEKICSVGTVLDEFGVGWEVHVMSAHRTPEQVADYAKHAKSKGLRVIIAAAGGAAHLAGVVAAHTTLPVIGIPVKTDVMGGLDSLLSTVQMPGDVPVATVGIGSGGAKNAGILAVEILSLIDDSLDKKLTAFKSSLGEKIGRKDAALREKIGK